MRLTLTSTLAAKHGGSTHSLAGSALAQALPAFWKTGPFGSGGPRDRQSARPPRRPPHPSARRLMTQIVVVSGNPRPGSRTSVLATAVGEALSDDPPTVLEVGGLGAGLLTPGDPATAAAVTALREADLLVI